MVKKPKSVYQYKSFLDIPKIYYQLNNKLGDFYFY